MAADHQSVAPEKLLRALPLQVLSSIRSGRQRMEQPIYNILFRWFAGLTMDAPVWDATVFSKKRDRLLEGDIARGFLAAILANPLVMPLLSKEHFSVEGTLIEAWASVKGFGPKEGSDEPLAPARNGERASMASRDARSASTPDPDARLHRKSAGQEARLWHKGHMLMENRNGLNVDAKTVTATDAVEREVAISMIQIRPAGARLALGADKAYDAEQFVVEMRQLEVAPHVAQNNKRRRSDIAGRTTRRAGYCISQRRRMEEVFGWMKTLGSLRKTRHRGGALVGSMFTLTAANYNAMRLPTLLADAVSQCRPTVPLQESCPSAQRKSPKSMSRVPSRYSQGGESPHTSAIFRSVLRAHCSNGEEWRR